MSHNLCHACSLRFARDVAVITPSRRSALKNRTLLMSDDNIDEVLEAIAAAEVTAGQSRSLAMALALQEYREQSSLDEETSAVRKAKRRYIEREREQGSTDLLKDYLIVSPTYTDEHFDRRFGVTKTLFRKLCASAAAKDIFFRRRRDATSRLGLSTEQKIAAALRVLVYAESYDQSDHFLRMSEETVRQSFLRLTRHITDSLFEEVVRLPTSDEAQAISNRFRLRGFPGCVGSIDCMKVY
jgi:methylphosphotriester-DNA--protein-cysteine methyltransferase